MRTQLATPPSVTLGWRAGELAGVAWLGEPGGGPGFSGNVRVYPAAGLATAWFANRMAISEPRIMAMADEIDRVWLVSK